MELTASTSYLAARSNLKNNPASYGSRKDLKENSSTNALNARTAISGTKTLEDADHATLPDSVSITAPAAQPKKDATNARETGSQPTSVTGVNKPFSTVMSHPTTSTEMTAPSMSARNAERASSQKVENVINARSPAASNA